MLISVPAETDANEKRVALVPDSAKKLVRAGFDVIVESGLGDNAGFYRCRLMTKRAQS
ncbi:MAG: hypothetical protein U5O39_13560 [Gammaproteobacteria bacterium]|nr:hypothetical protein [Gammaproteobacteria bacterium]